MRTCPKCRSTYPSEFTHCPRDGALLRAVSGWSKGTVVREKYQILDKIGEGGMGEVYKALHVHFKEFRALKVIIPEVASDEMFVKRFVQEGILTRKLQHSNAVRVEDIDNAEDGRPFIVMEYIQGQNLKDVILREAPMPPSRVCAIGRQVASALDAANALDIIHRDIKPANIILVGTPYGERVKVLDFGIAKLKEARVRELAGSTLTGTGVSLGTPAYMSPEQARGLKGNQLDGRSDLYSLGIVMYQMLTGQLPFKADTTMEMLMAHIQTPPQPIRGGHPEVPEALAEVVMKCLEKKPERRPATPQRLIEEIERAESSARPTGSAKPTWTPVAASPAVVPALLIETTPGRALVYIDGEPVGETSANGKLRFQRFAPGKHRVRLSVRGYRDHEQVVRISPGATARLVATLKPAKRTGRGAGGGGIISSVMQTPRGIVAALATLFIITLGASGFWWWKVRGSGRQTPSGSDQRQESQAAGQPRVETPSNLGPGGSSTGRAQGGKEGRAEKQGEGTKSERAQGNQFPEIKPKASAQNPGVTISPPSLDFGKQTLGTSADLIATVTSHGDLPSSINIAGVEGRDYRWKADCAGRNLAGGKSCSITVTFAPTAGGERPGRIDIHVAAAGTTEVLQVLSLHGIGAAPAQALAPATVAPPNAPQPAGSAVVPAPPRAPIASPSAGSARLNNDGQQLVARPSSPPSPEPEPVSKEPEPKLGAPEETVRAAGISEPRSATWRYLAIRNPVSIQKYFLTYMTALLAQHGGTITIGPDTFRFDPNNGKDPIKLPLSQIASVKSAKYTHPFLKVVAADTFTHSLELRTLSGKKFHFAVVNAADKPEAGTLLLQAIQRRAGSPR